MQGVGFRKFTCTRAREIGVVGWARNLDDGRVEVLAQGSEEPLNLLKKALYEGTSLSIVEKVEENKVTQTLHSKTFKQAADGEKPWQENL